MDELSANRGRQVAECPQVKVMRLEEKIAEQAAEIANLKTLAQAVVDAKFAWDSCNDRTANELARDHMMGRVYALAKALEDS
jgi:hypothetical protein